jgi:hypothetical protein
MCECGNCGNNPCFYSVFCAVIDFYNVLVHNVLAHDAMAHLFVLAILLGFNLALANFTFYVSVLQSVLLWFGYCYWCHHMDDKVSTIRVLADSIVHNTDAHTDEIKALEKANVQNVERYMESLTCLRNQINGLQDKNSALSDRLNRIESLRSNTRNN